MFEFRDFDRAPSLSGSDQRTEHQLQDGSLAERIRDDFEATAFLDKEAFKQVRRPDGPPIRHRESQVGDAGFEVVHEASDRAVVFATVVGNDAGCEFARDGPARRLIGRLRADLEVRPHILRHLGRQVAHAVCQATLPGGARKANLDRLDDARGAVRGHQQRIIQAAPLHVLEERDHRLGIFFGARHHVQQHTTALNRKTPGRQNRLAFGTRPQTLGDAIDKQIRDLVLAQVPLRERLVILPQPLPKLRHRGLR